MLAKVDVLAAIGTAVFSASSYLAEARLSPSTKVIQIDNNAWEIGKNNPVRCGIEGDIKSSLVDLTSALRKEMTPTFRADVKKRTAEIALAKKRDDEEFLARSQKEKNDVPIAPSRLMQEIKDNLKPGTRIVDDCWSSSAVLRRTLAFSEPKSFQRSRSGGSIGFGLPGALGVKLASPDRPVVCVSGDGSAAWSIQSLWTAAHYNIPVCFVIMANGCYQMVRSMKSRLLGEKAAGRNLGTDLCGPQIDFCRVAEGFGMQAQRVDQPAQLGPALKQAFELNEPNLIEVRTRA
jgi:benzoylformate decarboxylase